MVGCGAPESRYSQEQDTAPKLVLDPARIVDAVPQPTEIRAAGNVSPYTVNGVEYRVMSEAHALSYRAQGSASWYGSKLSMKKP